MNLLDDLIGMFIDMGLATESDVDIFGDYSPKEPDTCVMVYEYNGSAPSKWSPVSVRSFQVVCRSKRRMEAYNKCWSIYSKLLPFNSGIFRAGDADGILSLRNTPVLIDIDSESRALYAFNFAITIKI